MHNDDQKHSRMICVTFVFFSFMRQLAIIAHTSLQNNFCSMVVVYDACICFDMSRLLLQFFFVFRKTTGRYTNTSTNVGKCLWIYVGKKTPVKDLSLTQVGRFLRPAVGSKFVYPGKKTPHLSNFETTNHLTRRRP